MRHGHTVGRSKTPTYESWARMLSRCNAQPGDRRWPFYGARGITVCERWKLFENFLADMGIRPSGLTLDRRENDKGYEPGNCKWATRREQAENTRSTRWIVHDGQRRTLTGWARHLGVSAATIHRRMKSRGTPT